MNILDKYTTRQPWKMFYTVEYLRARCVVNEQGCWLWQGAKSHGYGTVGKNQTGATTVHKVIYILVHGRWDGNVELDHLCRNRHCCNPEHLELVTHLENCQRGISRCEKLTECKRGHSFEDGSYYLSKDGKRVCKQCQSERHRAYRERKKETTLPLDVFAIFGSQED